MVSIVRVWLGCLVSVVWAWLWVYYEYCVVVVYCECYVAMSCVSVCARVHVCMFDVGIAVWLLVV